MTFSFEFFQKFVNPFRIITHLFILSFLVFHQFFYFFFTGFHLFVPLYSFLSFIFLVDLLFLLLFFESRKKIYPFILFLFDSFFLFGLVWAVGASSIYIPLFLAFLQMLYIGLFLDWFLILTYGLWLSLLTAIALLFRGELTLPTAALTNISLCLSMCLSMIISRGFRFFTLKFQLLEESFNQLDQKKLEHRPEPHLELALLLARKIKPALKSIIPHTAQENIKKLKAFHQSIIRFIEFAEPLMPEDKGFQKIEDFNSLVTATLKKMNSHPLRPEKLEEKLNLKAKGVIRGSRHNLEEALSHLFINSFQALKTIEKRKQQMFINSYDSSSWLILEIIDKGHGMEEEDIKQAFDPLFSKRFHSGGIGGLGLSLTQKIIKAHGGSIELQSIPEKETLVRIKLPLIPLEETIDPPFKTRKRSA